MSRLWGLVTRLDDRGGASQLLARGAIGVAKSVRGTLAQRRLALVHWSPRRKRWVHRWPEGRFADDRRWRNPAKWATNDGLYDMGDLLWRHYRPRPGDTVFDIGAGHGGETYYLAGLVGPVGRVVSIEAAPAPFRRLEELVSLNNWPQVELVQMAVSDRPGTLMITDEGDDWVAGNVYSDHGSVVRATTVDELCAERGITEVDWIKMNIEGAEKDAVRGMERMAPHIRHLTISCHDFLGTEWGRSLEVVTGWLVDHGFEVTQRGEGDDWEASYIYARRSALTATD